MSHVASTPFSAEPTMLPTAPMAKASSIDTTPTLTAAMTLPRMT